MNHSCSSASALFPGSFLSGSLFPGSLSPGAFFSSVLLLALIQMTGASAVMAASVQPDQIVRNDPVRLLEQATDQALKLARAAQDYAAADRERYYSEVESIVDHVVDLPYFARGVMGVYASARQYQALGSNRERQEFRARVDKFAETLKRSFILTYADALLSFEGERVELESSPGIDASSDDVILRQTIYSTTDQYSVHYRLRKNKSGDWLIVNVIVEGLNIGAAYRNQFAEAVERNRGDVDYVVNHWQEIMTKVEPDDDGASTDSQ